MTVPDCSDRGGADRSDDELLTAVAALASRSGKRPSRNAVMGELGIGAGRAARLLDRFRARSGSPVHVVPDPDRSPDPAVRAVTIEAATSQVSTRTDTGPVRSVRAWWHTHRAVLAVLVVALPASVAIWSGWVGMGGLTGFGPVNLLPGLGGLRLNTAVTLPIGIEAYAALALHVWLTRPDRQCRSARFARRSAWSALLIGASGQAAYHVMTAAGMSAAPTLVTVLVSILPVAVLGMATSLVTIVRSENSLGKR